MGSSCPSHGDVFADEPPTVPESVDQRQEIVFEYGDDLWIVSRSRGSPRRLTTGAGREFNPHFSPDGTKVAFSGEYEGYVDVYVIAAEGGVPRRLTYHPSA